MALPGECFITRDVKDTIELQGLSAENSHTFCSECDALLNLRVCESAAGFYIGFWCDEDGPWSRESYHYYQDYDVAQAALVRGNWAPRM